jgi:hypothetical protein
MTLAQRQRMASTMKKSSWDYSSRGVFPLRTSRLWACRIWILLIDQWFRFNSPLGGNLVVLVGVVDGATVAEAVVASVVNPLVAELQEVQEEGVEEEVERSGGEVSSRAQKLNSKGVGIYEKFLVRDSSSDSH